MNLTGYSATGTYIEAPDAATWESLARAADRPLRGILLTPSPFRPAHATGLIGVRVYAPTLTEAKQDADVLDHMVITALAEHLTLPRENKLIGDINEHQTTQTGATA